MYGSVPQDQEGAEAGAHEHIPCNSNGETELGAQDEQMRGTLLDQ